MEYVNVTYSSKNKGCHFRDVHRFAKQKRSLVSGPQIVLYPDCKLLQFEAARTSTVPFTRPGAMQWKFCQSVTKFHKQRTIQLPSGQMGEIHRASIRALKTDPSSI